jgi:DnaJ-class molecular chaperone
MQKVVILCEKCAGTGYTRNSELVNHHKGEYDEWFENCWACKGSGRQVKTHTIQIEPYVPISQDQMGRK